MCQLFALNSNAPTAVTFAFTGFSARGGHTAEHADGWGIAFHGEGGCRSFHDDAPASHSPLADFVRTHPMRATAVLAHIRKATQGAVQLSNCHPFQRPWLGRPWTFCHNGNLVDFEPALDEQHQPLGSTDSERAFCWLLQRLAAHFDGQPAPGWRAIAPVLARLVAEVAVHGPFNLLLTDGQAVYAHCSTRLHWLVRRHPFAQVRLVDADLTMDLARANGPQDRMVLVATEPLTHDEPWHAMAPGELFVFADGDAVWRQRCAASSPTGAPGLAPAQGPAQQTAA